MSRSPPRTTRTRGPQAAGPPPRQSAPSEAQRSWLALGLAQPGGKLPLFDADGQEIDRRTIKVCIDRGWAQPWTTNPVRPDWIVCRLTPAGYRVLGHEPPLVAG